MHRIPMSERHTPDNEISAFLPAGGARAGLAGLPVGAVLGAVCAALADGTNAVLSAPPGAGKTSLVPLALLTAAWRGDRTILLLEPRRLAARAAAERLAENLDEALGERVGYRIRLESRISARTRILVVTEGVFTRMILDDPGLEGIAAVIFDEIHERSLAVDLGLALALEAQAVLRPDLRLLAMSATLDGARMASVMADADGRPAPVIHSAGRMFPVETRYEPRDSRTPPEPAMAAAIIHAMAEAPGSVLAFLPGQAEILRTERILRERLTAPGHVIAPLYGSMDFSAQRLAIAPAALGQRKIVLATAIAETSLTIEDVRIVVDSGLARVPVHDPASGLSRLVTRRVSRASADQRRGRAGRTAPGLCIRLWAEGQNEALDPFERPEILATDLTGLALDLAQWGARDCSGLRFPDPPPPESFAAAREELAALGALDADGALTELGRSMAAMGLSPRLSALVLRASAAGYGPTGAELALLLSEPALGGGGADLDHRLAAFQNDRSARVRAGRTLAATWAARAAAVSDANAPGESDAPAGLVLALGMPDRIAKARPGRAGAFLMANGKEVQVDPHDPLAGAAFLAVAEAQGAGPRLRMTLGAALTETEALRAAGRGLTDETSVEFDPARRGLRATRVRRLRRLSFSEAPVPVPLEDRGPALLAGLRTHGLDMLPFGSAEQALRARLAFLSGFDESRDDSDAWPPVDDATLLATADQWLAPFLAGETGFDGLADGRLLAALEARLTRDQRRVLDRLAPACFDAPTGTRLPIDYAADGGPRISVRLQEMLGVTRHPVVGAREIPLVIELLSPAGRPIQITRDLPGFWRGSWAAVKVEMKGRYPKHVWPDDPAAALPTRRAKPRPE